jgi:hypothetical protein
MQEEKYLNLLSKYLSDRLSIKERDDLFAWLDVNPDLENLLRNTKLSGVSGDCVGNNLYSDTELGWIRMQIAIDSSKGSIHAVFQGIRKYMLALRRGLRSIYFFIKPSS